MKIKTLVTSLIVCLFAPAVASATATVPTWEMYRQALSKNVNLDRMLDQVKNRPVSPPVDPENTLEALTCKQAALDPSNVQRNRECVTYSVPLLWKSTKHMDQDFWSQLYKDDRAAKALQSSAQIWGLGLGRFIHYVDMRIATIQKLRGEDAAKGPELAKLVEREVSKDIHVLSQALVPALFQPLPAANGPFEVRINDKVMTLYRDGKPYLGPGWAGGRVMGSAASMEELKRVHGDRRQ